MRWRVRVSVEPYFHLLRRQLRCMRMVIEPKHPNLLQIACSQAFRQRAEAEDARRCLVSDTAAAPLATKDHEGSLSTAVPQLRLRQAIWHTIYTVCEVELGVMFSSSLDLAAYMYQPFFQSTSFELPIPITPWTTTTTRQRQSTNSLIQTPSSLRYTHTGRTRKSSADTSTTDQLPAHRVDSPTQDPTLIARRPSHPPTESCRRTKTHSRSHRLRA
jgi:hypothetical protein